MADGKTLPTPVAVDAFLAGVEPAARRAEAPLLDQLFRKVTGQAPQMWGPSIVGYGEYRTIYASGRNVRSLRVGFSPRKAKHSLYVACTCDGREGAELAPLLERLGKHAVGAGGCLYVNKLADIDLAVLEQIVALGWQTSLANYPDGEPHG